MASTAERSALDVVGVPPRARRPRRRRFGHWRYLAIPTALLVVFFLAPMVLMVRMSLLRYPPSTLGGYSFVHYANVLTEPVYRRVAVTTFIIATSAQLLMLAVGIPLAYIMAFRAGRWELPLLLLLVLADELNPIVKIYAWRMLLGHDGILNWVLLRLHLVSEPVTWLLFGRFSVIITLATGWITYTTIPIYAAMKAIDPSLFDVADDLGAGWWTKARRILVPLAAPGIFIAMILVYIPMFTDFVTNNLVGGTNSYMLGNSVNDLILSTNNWGDGSALNFILLVLSVGLSLLAYRLARLHRIDV
ncbi:MAG: ABC transporter permease [Actinobacteria bacterium]|nr:MAG: ABC transporter permease [Actinomycetota bacterium]